MQTTCSREFEILEFAILNQDETIASDVPIELEIKIRNNGYRFPTCQYSANIFTSTDARVVEYVAKPMPIPQNKKVYTVRLKCLHHGLYKGFYKLCVQVGFRDYTTSIRNIDCTGFALGFEVRYMDRATKREYSIPGNWMCKVIHSGDLVECTCE